MKPTLRRDRAEAAAHFVALAAVVLVARVWFGNLELWGGLRIDLALITLPLLAVTRNGTFGMVAGFLLGLLVDAPTPAWMGASSVAYAVVGYLAGSYGQTMHMDKTLARGILVISSVLVFDFCFGLLTVGIARPFWLHVLVSLGSAMLTGVAAAVITLLLKYLQTRTRAGRELPAGA